MKEKGIQISIEVHDVCVYAGQSLTVFLHDAHQGHSGSKVGRVEISVSPEGVFEVVSSNVEKGGGEKE